MNQSTKQPLTEIIALAAKAGKAILEVYDLSDFGIEVKEDNSPLTLADLASSDVINSYLEKTEFPIIAKKINNWTIQPEKNGIPAGW